MLSIAAIKTGQEDYYLELGAEDYYLHGGEPNGYWLGSGAELLGLSGEVDKSHLKLLAQGYHPFRPKHALVQNAGNPNRQPAWDLTFSAPKTLSVLWSAANDETRLQIKQSQHAAVQKTIEYLENEFSNSRIGSGGEELVSAKIVVAAFEHSTSRALEPQLHHHCLVLNVGVGPDGQTRTLVSKPFYENKMLLGALYRSELAAQLLKRLGLELRRKKTWFEVAGIPTPLVREMSTRRRQIEAELGRAGVETANAAAFAALKTRPIKEIVPARSELLANYRAQALKFGLSPQAVDFLLGRRPNFDQEAALAKGTVEALDKIVKEQSHFSEHELLRHLAEAPSTLGVPLTALVSHATKTLDSNPDIISLGVRNGQHRFTTQAMLAVEEELLSVASRLSEGTWKPLSNKVVESVITRKRDLNESVPSPRKKNDVPIVKAAKLAQKTASRLLQGEEGLHTLTFEQGHAVAHITQSPGRIKLVTGYAGTGKTTMLRAAREALEKQGYRVLGAALSGKAARTLELEAGIESNTVRMRELQINPRFLYKLSYNARDAWRDLTSRRKSIFRKKVHKLKPLKIDKKTVLIVDEASMLGTRDNLMLLKAVEKGGGSIVLLGDQPQIASIDAGGPFGSLAKRLGSAKLQQVVRQQDERERQAVQWMPKGEASKVLRLYAGKKQLHVSSTRDELYTDLINDWTQRGGAERPAEHVICVALNREVDDLNDLAQAARIRRDQLDTTRSLKRGGETFYLGDRITFTERSQKHGLENGDSATLVAIKKGLAKQISVIFDGETTPRALPVKATKFRRGYAYTTHKLQGASIDNVYLGLTGSMLNQEMAYVQVSRHKKRLDLYTTSILAGEQLADLADPNAPKGDEDQIRSPLAKLMSKSESKDLAHDIIAEQQIRPFGSVGHVAKVARCGVRRAYVVTLQELASRGHASQSRQRFLDFTHSTS